MYSLFRNDPVGSLGMVVDPNLPYIKRMYTGMLKDVKAYYHRNPKFCDSRNIIANMIQHFLIDFKVDDATFAKQIERTAEPMVRMYGFVSAINRGKIYPTGVTLGPQTEEIVISTYEGFDLTGLRSRWRTLAPIRYLYHTRTDCNLPIMNNTTPGKGYGVTLINIPMLLVQYRYWLFEQFGHAEPSIENVYRFVGAYPLVNAIDSYLDIAYFNRLSRQAYGIKNPSYPLPHPFYLTDMVPRLDKLAERTNMQIGARPLSLEDFARITPMVAKDNLFQVIQLPKEPVTVQNEWALAIARFPYIKYLVHCVRNSKSSDLNQLNIVIREVREAMYGQAFKMNGSSPMIDYLKRNVDEMVRRGQAVPVMT